MYDGIMTLIFMWLVSFTVNVCVFHNCARAFAAGLISTIVSAIVIDIFANIIWNNDENEGEES